MKRLLKTSFLQKKWILLIVWMFASCSILFAEWGVDQRLEVQIFEGPKGLPENIYYQEHQIRYHGSLEKGLAHGEGRLFWNNGKVLYEGGFMNGLFEGNGVYRDRNGFRIYQGEFKQGRFHGSGTLYDSNGGKVLHEGLFKEGRPL